MKVNRGTPKGKVDGYDLNSSVKVLLIAAAGGAVHEIIPLLKNMDSEFISCIVSGALVGVLQFLNRWRRDNSHERY